jgi:protoporphyrinogen oxidase
MEERLASFPGLYLTGNAFRGVALNDCTREAWQIAQRVEQDAMGLQGHDGRKEE